MNETIPTCTLGELMIYQIALTIENNSLVFHGFGSPLVQLALHVAKRFLAPELILVAGATYAVNPTPVFLTPTTNDFAMSLGAECQLNIEELFDLAASGRMGRMFLSGLQIDRFGNINVTCLGAPDKPGLKLPGGGGGGNLSCDARHITIWTAAHRALPDAEGKRRYRLGSRCDFVTSLGHYTDNGIARTALSLRGLGPDRIVTDLGVFDFNEQGHARLRAVYPDTSVELIAENTEFEFPVADDLSTAALPDRDMIQFIRKLDPMNIHQHELSPVDRERCFELGT
jgi:glutaconate CoA-transferase subunit B